MPKIHLQQHRFTYIACGPFNKKKKRIKKNRIKKFKETGDSQYIYQNELQSVTKIVRLVPLSLCPMLVTSLLGHSWPPLPGRAFSTLIQH